MCRGFHSREKMPGKGAGNVSAVNTINEDWRVADINN